MFYVCIAYNKNVSFQQMHFINYFFLFKKNKNGEKEKEFLTEELL